uniref:Uncharacterized protein n=1 Tax=Panagrolaimus davidi TaxID=227884 RepID=A0A914P4E0_9BILA
MHKSENQGLFLSTLEWKTVEAKGTIPSSRDGHTSNVYNGKMYIFGGFEYTHRRYTNSVYAFNFTTLTWENLPTKGKAPSHRDFHASAIVNDKMYIFELETIGDRPTFRRSHSMWEYCGKLYLFGGYDSINDIHFNDFYVFDTIKLCWTRLRPNGKHPTPRRRQCSAIVGDKVFIFGGTMPDKAKRPGTLCDLADMYVLDYCASLKTLAAKALIQYGTSIKTLPTLGQTLDRDLYYMSQPNTIAATTPSTTTNYNRSETTTFSYNT